MILFVDYSMQFTEWKGGAFFAVRNCTISFTSISVKTGEGPNYFNVRMLA